MTTGKLKFLFLSALGQLKYQFRSKSTEDFLLCLDHLGCFNKDKDTYWAFITVDDPEGGHGEKENSTEGMKRFLSEFDKFLTLDKVHTSEPFANTNYWEGNYLTLHIYKVAKK